jgi:hypothetical protein
MSGFAGSIGVAIEYSRWTLGWASSWLGASSDGVSSEEVEVDASIWKKFFHDIYGPTNTCHHNNSKVLTCDIPPFLLEIPFGLLIFVLELR